MPMHVTRALRLNARRFPEKPALVFEGATQTYRALYRRVCRLAHALQGMGHGPGDKIAVLALNHPDTVAAYFAIMGIGAIPALINYRLLDEDIAHVVRQSDSRTVILGAGFADRVDLLRPLAGTFVVMGDGAKAVGEVHAFDALIEKGRESDLAVVGEKSTAMLHTSGTTGKPKGALRSDWGLEQRAVEQGFATDDRTLCVLPVCLSAGFGYTMLPLYLGATAYLMEGFDVERTFDLIERERITSGLLFPTLLRDLLDAPRFSRFDGGSIRLIQSGGGAVEADLRAGIVDRLGPVLSIWAAASEAGPYANIKGDDVLRYATGNCVGRAFFGVELKLLDDDGREVETGEVGEICTRSDMQFDGYYKDEALTAETRRGDYVTVGDLGRIDENGHLYFVGRKRDIIKSGGINIYAPEIEEALSAHPAIAEVACIGLPDRRLTETVCAVVVTRPGATLDQAALDAFCRDRLSGYKRPRRLVVVDALPRNLTGRVLKDDLKKRIAAETDGTD